MSVFDLRPKGTVIHGAFRDLGNAERALRVLKNAGYLRSEVASQADSGGNASAVVTVDAAATGAVRAAEILAEFGAELHYDLASGAPAVRVTPAPPLLEPQSDRKPRIRKSVRPRLGAPSAPPSSSPPPPPTNVTIRTRGSDIMPLGESFTSKEAFPEDL